jgi:hypothetical protein
MRKLCYEFNPERMRLVPAYTNLTLLEKAIYKELIDIIWESKSQYKIPMNIPYLAKKICCSEDELNSTCEKLFKGSSSLLISEMCLETCTFQIQSSELKNQIKIFLENKELEKSKILAPRETKKKTNKTLVNKIRIIENASPNIKYLKADERDLAIYQGWLPTKNFDTNGQSYVVNQELIDDLKTCNPEINIGEQLIKIFNWLSDNEDKRRSVAQMNEFIINWVARASGGPENENFLDSLDDDLEKLLNSQFESL